MSDLIENDWVIVIISMIAILILPVIAFLSYYWFQHHFSKKIWQIKQLPKDERK
jgi:DMSO/TMAO reductase YedYZ heme-binding membrane subunit